MTQTEEDVFHIGTEHHLPDESPLVGQALHCEIVGNLEASKEGDAKHYARLYEQEIDSDLFKSHKQCILPFFGVLDPLPLLVFLYFVSLIERMPKGVEDHINEVYESET